MIGKERLITAAWALPLLAAALVYLPPAGIAGLVALAAATGQWELYRFHFKGRLPAFAWAGCAVGALVVLGGLSGPNPLLPMAAGTAVILVLRMGAERPMESALAEAAVVVLGVAYVALLLSHVVLLAGAEEGVRWLFFLLLVTWANDAAAYYIGSRHGRTSLTAVSPNKTVEGTLGGIACSVAAAYLGLLFVPGLDGWDPLCIGLLLGALALLGDLAESLFKRGAGVKDASTLIPGHGGLMDKLDAFLFTAPGLYYYLSLVVWR
ncbi:MAG: phosphatidate cytidylyltransferase [Nitrospirae bacterium]|nr:phosphatidate cytidylyltransferase [Nitrospirota bacterium]